MGTMTIVNRLGLSIEARYESDLSMMESLRNAGCDELLALCGGCCSCATCHVYIDTAFLPVLAPMTSDENDLLESATGRLPSSRLSCQIMMNETLDHVVVHIAPED